MHWNDVRPSFESSPRLVLGHRDLEPTGDRDWNTDAQFENLGLVDADRIGKTKPSGLRTSQNAQKRGTGSPLVREDDRLVPDDRARMLVTSIHGRTVHDIPSQGWVIEDPSSKEPLGGRNLEDRDGNLPAANRQIVLDREHSIAVSSLADPIEIALSIGGQRLRDRPLDLDAQVGNRELQHRLRRKRLQIRLRLKPPKNQ